MFDTVSDYLKSLSWYMTCLGASHIIGGYEFSTFVLLLGAMGALGEIFIRWIPPFPLWLLLMDLFGSDPFAC